MGHSNQNSLYLHGVIIFLKKLYKMHSSILDFLKNSETLKNSERISEEISEIISERISERISEKISEEINEEISVEN